MKGRSITNVVIGLLAVCGISIFSSEGAFGQSYQAWYDNAQERIDTLRKGNFAIQIFDKDGNPYSGDVSVRMKKHEYPFGIAFDFYEGSASMGNSYSTLGAVQSDLDAEIYQTERWNDYLAYALPVEIGTEYKLTLKFAEIFHNASGARIFDVNVDGKLFLDDFDTYAAAGGKNISIDTSIVLTTTKNTISIELIASLDNAAIKGIVIENMNSLEVTRINCGGPALTTLDGNQYISEEGYFDPDISTVSSKEQWMKAAMYKYFNYGVTGNSFKWSGVQPQHREPDYSNFENAVRWTQKVGWELRGHNLLWGGNDDHSMPGWVRLLPTPEAITDTCKMRVIRDVTRYKGIIKEYDVINEPLTGHADSLRNNVGDSIIWNCFKWARSADPDAELFINDYNVEYNWGQAAEYRDLILKIKEMGGPVTGVGMQAHFWDCCRPNIDELVKNVNIVAEAGLPIRFTEYDFGGNLSQLEQARDFIKVLTIAFSHPSITGMISWGLSDDGAWRENTGFFDASHKPKIAADTLLYYTKTKWATNFDTVLNTSNELAFNAYYGDYEIEVSFDGNVKIFTVPCLKDYSDTVFVLHEAEAGLKGPELVSVELSDDDSLSLTFTKPIEGSTIKKGDFRFFSNHEIAITSIAVDPAAPETLKFTLSEAVTPGDYISISYFPGYLEGTDGSEVQPFGPECIHNPLPDPLLHLEAGEVSQNSFQYAEGFGPSTYESFTVSGEWLTGNIVISVTNGFEVSVSPGSGYVQSLTLNQNNMVVSQKTIYVRLKSGLIQDAYTGEIRISSPGIPTNLITLSGNVEASPEIFVSTVALNDFTYEYGSGPSESQMFNVTGSNLFDDVTVQSPDHFELSQSTDSDFGPEIVLPQTNGTIDETPVYVRLKSGLEVDAYLGTLSVLISGVAIQTVDLTGEVRRKTGIPDYIKGNASVVSKQYFNLIGQTVYETDDMTGIFIEKLIMSDGTILTRKVLRMRK
ncbi:endo-1,4-beta-xylanase [Bacteroidota bacterium]